MILIDKEIIEAFACGLILSIRNKDWTDCGREYTHLQTDLEECIKECLLSHEIHIKGKM